jgi:hypothetical protein
MSVGQMVLDQKVLNQNLITFQLQENLFCQVIVRIVMHFSRVQKNVFPFEKEENF